MDEENKDTDVAPFEVQETPIDEMFAQMDRSPATLPDRLDGDIVPEEFRGKSLNDVFNHVKQLQNTLQINNELMKRLSAEPPKPQVIQVAPSAAPVAPAQQWPTQEQLAELIASDDVNDRLRAFQIMQAMNNERLAEGLERRLAAISAGTISAAEQQARQKYPLEFELFSDVIEKYKGFVPSEGLTTAHAWDELINQARGSDPVKYVTELQKRQGVKPMQEQVRELEAATAGFVPPTRPGPSTGSSRNRLDELQRKIAAEWGMSENEYLHFNNSSDIIQ